MIKSNYNICYCYPLRGSARWKKKLTTKAWNIKYTTKLTHNSKEWIAKWESEKRDIVVNGMEAVV
jgi:hypothetical protein